MHVFRNDIAAVQQASSHVLPITRIAFDHLVVGFEAGHRDLLHGIGFMRCLGSRDNGRVGDKGEVNAGIWDQISLKFVQIDVEGPIEAERGSDRGYDYMPSAPVIIPRTHVAAGKRTLSNEPVKILVIRSLNPEVPTANVVNRLIINHEAAVGVLQGGVGC